MLEGMSRVDLRMNLEPLSSFSRGSGCLIPRAQAVSMAQYVFLVGPFSPFVSLNKLPSPQFPRAGVRNPGRLERKTNKAKQLRNRGLRM